MSRKEPRVLNRYEDGRGAWTIRATASVRSQHPPNGLSRERRSREERQNRRDLTRVETKARELAGARPKRSGRLRAPPGDLPSYARVLLDVLTGGTTLSVRADEAEQAWRVVKPVLDSWDANRVPIEEYAAGSDGPRR